MCIRDSYNWNILSIDDMNILNIIYGLAMTIYQINDKARIWDCFYGPRQSFYITGCEKYDYEFIVADYARHSDINLITHKVLLRTIHGNKSKTFNYLMDEVKHINHDYSEHNKLQLFDLFIISCTLGKIEISAILLSNFVKDPNVTVVETYPLKAAIIHNHVDIIKLLVNHEKINCSINENEPLYLACSLSQIETVELLLSNHEVNPSDCDNRCLKVAFYNANYNIIKLLLNDSRIQVNKLDEFIQIYQQKKEEMINIDRLIANYNP